MFNLLNKETNALAKVWFGTATAITLIVSLPFMLLVLPVVFAIQLTHKILGEEPAKKQSMKQFGTGDLFNGWTSFFDIKKPEGWD